MFTNKNTIKTFGILIITFIGLLGIKYLFSHAIESSKETYQEKLLSFVHENMKNGLSKEQALKKVMKEKPDLVMQMGKESSSKSKIILIVSILAAIILLYFSSIAITYFTREKRT